ncbi:hypothetical protein A0H81_06224 [Grifola frondosa]|uniref:Uncharacterized protein n=1 Tax=Grifola frondosa TaxID=5627 RepID=A0A1C7MB32_GRIFR|nr:hypothetical protein A0H81_06224 [Grifola frondosa]
MKSQSTFDDLPNELILVIKELIEDTDLRTHVCFYHACRRTAALYDKDMKTQNAFWERCCRLSGIGSLPEDGQDICWKAIAFECISKDGFCTHPHCGVTLLEANVLGMKYALDLRVEWNEHHPEHHFRSWSDYMSVADELDKLRIPPHALFKHITFSPIRTGVENDARVCCVARTSPSRDCQHSLCALYLHPIARRSFATFPPLDTMWLAGYVGLEGREYMNVENARGVTVWDIQTFIRNQLEYPISDDSAFRYSHSTNGREDAGPFETYRDRFIWRLYEEAYEL